jgi:hypothetical protein
MNAVACLTSCSGVWLLASGFWVPGQMMKVLPGTVTNLNKIDPPYWSRNDIFSVFEESYRIVKISLYELDLRRLLSEPLGR